MTDNREPTGSDTARKLAESLRSMIFVSKVGMVTKPLEMMIAEIEAHDALLVAAAMPKREELARILFELDNKLGDAPWPTDWERQPYCQWALRDADKILAALLSTASQNALAATLRQAGLETYQFLEPYLDPPKPSHSGSCGPESGCDANCMDAANFAEFVNSLRAALPPAPAAEADPDKEKR